MISNLFKKNNIEDFIEDNVKIEIEKPNKNLHLLNLYYILHRLILYGEFF